MRAKHVAVLGLVAGLIVGSLAVSAEAKKKPKKKPKKKTITKIVPKDTNFFLRRDECNTDADNVRLSITDGADGGNLCGFVQEGIYNEAVLTAGQDAERVTHVWPAADGLPLTLDATKDIKAKIQVVSSHLNAAPDQGAGAGAAELEIVLKGTTGGVVKDIGTATATQTITPAASRYTYEFSFKPAAALDKAVFTTLELETIMRGAMFGNCLVELDTPPATLTIPSLVKQKG